MNTDTVHINQLQSTIAEQVLRDGRPSALFCTVCLRLTPHRVLTISRTVYTACRTCQALTTSD